MIHLSNKSSYCKFVFRNKLAGIPSTTSCDIGWLTTVSSTFHIAYTLGYQYYRTNLWGGPQGHHKFSLTQGGFETFPTICLTLSKVVPVHSDHRSIIKYGGH